jgi:hypothetical protein
VQFDLKKLEKAPSRARPIANRHFISRAKSFFDEKQGNLFHFLLLRNISAIA